MYESKSALHLEYHPSNTILASEWAMVGMQNVCNAGQHLYVFYVKTKLGVKITQIVSTLYNYVTCALDTTEQITN